MEDPCEALDQEVVGLAVVDWTGGPWVSHGGVAGGLLSSQMASELLLAARNVRFPNKVQLRAGKGVDQARVPLLLPYQWDGPRTGAVPGRCGKQQGSTLAGVTQAASESRPRWRGEGPQLCRALLRLACSHLHFPLPNPRLLSSCLLWLTPTRTGTFPL